MIKKQVKCPRCGKVLLRLYSTATKSVTCTCGHTTKLIDYRTVHHKGTHIVFLDSDNEIDEAVFSSREAAIKFVKWMKGHNASVHDEHGDIIAYSHKGGSTLCQP